MKATTLARFRRSVATALATGLSFLVVGCQSTSSGKATTAAAATNAPLVTNPLPVVVCDFAFDVARLRTDEGLTPVREGPARRIMGNLRPEETTEQKEARLAGLLAETIAKELTTMKIPATRQTKGAPWPTTGLVVGGELLQVDEGNLPLITIPAQ